MDELWPELLDRLDNADMPHSDKGSRCVAIEDTGKHLLITDWTKLLDNMEERLKDSTSGLAEIRQLRGLVQFAESGEGKSALAGEELVSRVTEIGKTSGWIHTRGLIAVVPKGSTRADNYGAALERIAKILDELAEPRDSSRTTARRSADDQRKERSQVAELRDQVAFLKTEIERRDARITELVEEVERLTLERDELIEGVDRG